MQVWERIVSEIYECVADGSGWPEVLEGFAAAVKAESALIYIKSKSARHEETLATGTIHNAPARVKRYLEDYEPISPVFLRYRGVPQGQLRTLGDYAFSQSYQDSAYYQNWVRPQGWADMIGGHLIRTERSAGWLCLRRAHDRGLFEPTQVKLAQKIAPHLARALRLRAKFVENGFRGEALQSSIDAMSFGVFVTDADAKLLIVNRAGEEILRCADGLRLRGRALSCDRAGDTKTLLAAIRSCSGPLVANKPIKVDFTIGRSAARPLTAHVLPAASLQGSRSRRLAAATIFVSDPLVVHDPTAILSSEYGLTPAEQRLLREVVENPGVSKVAERLGISINTGRSHMKSIFAKTGERFAAQFQSGM